LVVRFILILWRRLRRWFTGYGAASRRYGRRTGISIGKSFVAETVRRHRYAIEDERRRVQRRQAKRGPRNRVWAIDLTGKHDTAGTYHDILGLIDHGTRRLLALKPIPTLSS
jgi:putative transposase